MTERIPEAIPDLPQDNERRAAQDAFLNVFLDIGQWELESHGDNRSALVLLGQIIHISVGTASMKRLTARLRHFLDNEAVRRNFDASLESTPSATSRKVKHCPTAPANPR